MTTRTLATHAAFLDHYRRAATVMRLYMTLCECAFMVGAEIVETLPPRQLFNGRPDGFLVKRFSGKGGFCSANDCVEVRDEVSQEANRGRC